MSSCSTPEEREKKNAAWRRYYDRVKDTPEYREKRREAERRRYHEDPEYRKRQAERKRSPEYRESRRLRYQNDLEYKERLKEAQKCYYDKIKNDPEFKRKNCERVKAWTAANPDKVKERRQSEAYKQYRKQYYEKNKDRLNAKLAALRAANPEYYRKLGRDKFLNVLRDNRTADDKELKVIFKQIINEQKK